MLVGVAAAIAVATIGRAHIGADFFDYLEWTKAFLTADVTQISSPVVSPEGYPLIQYHPGTGALFALPKLVAPSIPLRVSAYLAAGAATLVLWTCIAALVARAAGGRADIVLLGIPLLFIATHAGYQSTAIASELLSLALMAVLLVTLNLGSEETAPFSILVFGCAAGLLIGVRANLAPYVAAGALVYFRRILRAPVTRARKVYLALLVIVPVATGCAQVLTVDHWMTGSWTGSPYVFGDAQFQSVDFSHPRFLTVLLHPRHGLLAYHPLYVVLIWATIAGLLSSASGSDARLGWGAFLVAAAAALALQACWYDWWMGRGTFGGRQLAVWAILFMPPWIHRLAGAKPDSQGIKAWWLMSAVAALWSYPLLLGGITNFLSGQEFLWGVWGAIRATFIETPWPLLALAAGACVLWLLHGREARSRAGMVLVWSLMVVYLFHDNRLLAGAGDGQRLLAMGVLQVGTVGLMPLALHQAERSQHALGKLGARLRLGSQILTLCAFCVVAGLCVRLSLRAAPVPLAAREQCFGYRAPFDLLEVQATLLDYADLRGFEEDKRRLSAFVSRAGARYRINPILPDSSRQACLARHGIALRAWE